METVPQLGSSTIGNCESGKSFTLCQTQISMDFMLHIQFCDNIQNIVHLFAIH